MRTIVKLQILRLMDSNDVKIGVGLRHGWPVTLNGARLRERNGLVGHTDTHITPSYTPIYVYFL